MGRFYGLFMIAIPFVNLTMDSDISLLLISASIQSYLGGAGDDFFRRLDSYYCFPSWNPKI